MECFVLSHVSQGEETILGFLFSCFTVFVVVVVVIIIIVDVAVWV